MVQVHTDADVGQGQVWGRAEHIVSGQVTYFQTTAELVQFLVQVLTDGHRGRSGSRRHERSMMPWQSCGISAITAKRAL